jgi:hypothetical protein
VTSVKNKAKKYLSQIKNNIQVNHDGTIYPKCVIEIDPVLTVKIMQERGKLYPWLQNIMENLLKEMYDNLQDAPNVKKLIVKVYPFDGVAFTRNGVITTVKEIHISSTYIEKIPDNRKITELEGVLCHEMVHAFQYDGNHTAPTGFIEGIADYYRLRMGLAPPHWNQTHPDNWDVGYEKTGFFFDFLDKNVAPNAIKRMNLYLRDHTWSENDIFQSTCGESAKNLYNVYRQIY